jgi:branched-chain amino acid transport system ATP-binding protein
VSKLRATDISISFGGLRALDSVGIEVEPGEIRGIIGPNGAGKTTLLNVICGIDAPDSGTVWLDGESINGLKTSQIADRGIGRTFQTTKLFKGMTVLENVMTGLHGKMRASPFAAAFSFRHVLREEAEAARRAREVLEFVRMIDFADEEATALSFGQQRLVEIARALVSEPEVLLLDEPAVGLSMTRVTEVDELLRRIRRERGVTIVMIEHVIRLVMGVCDRITVLNFGRLLTEGTPGEVRRHPEVIEAYLGATAPHAA